MFEAFLGGMVIGVLLTIGLLKMTASEEPMGCIVILSILTLLLFSTLIILQDL